MRTSKLFSIVLCVCLGHAAHIAAAQEYDDLGETGLYGYTSIYYDPSTNVVTAYSETDLYGGDSYYYEAIVSLSSNGYSDRQQSPNANDNHISATIQYQGTAGQTYTAYGSHSAEVAMNYWGLVDDDYYGLEEWAPYDILSFDNYPFTAFSPETDTFDPYIDLGETYDAASVSIPPNCGTNDPRTTLIQEYVNYHTPYFPQCSEFTQSISDPNFTFGELNTGQYSWAIIRSYFLSDLDSLLGLTSFTIESAYRNPVKEASVSSTYHPGSRHQYGDAVDIPTSTQANWTPYQTYGHQLGACVEPFIYQRTYNHAHLDWRTQATVGPHYSSCPKEW